jgi:hypothetical protein
MVAFAMAVALCGALATGTTPIVASDGRQAVRSEKDSRTPAQQKINSALLYEIYRRRGEAKQKGVPSGETGVRVDRKGRALVDLRAEVGPDLLKKLQKLRATIVTTSREYRSIVAWVPVLKLEGLAEDASVRAIEPAAEATIKN